MFKTIVRLIFGGEEPSRVDVTSGDVVEEEWFVVSRHEAVSEENRGAEPIGSQPSNSALHGDAVADMEADVGGPDDLDSPDPSRRATGPALTGSTSPAEAVTQSARTRRATAWADRRRTTRDALQRQKRVRHGVQRNFFHLHQPAGHRKLGH